MDIKTFGGVEGTIRTFVKKGKIEPEKVSVLDKLILDCKNEEIKVLSNSLLTLDDQRNIFGVIRNVSEIANVMKEHLVSAHAMGENPTTAELCLEITPIMRNVLSGYQECIKSRFNRGNINKIMILSDELRRTSRRNGFKRNFYRELDSIKLSEKTKVEFMQEFRDNVRLIYHEYEDSD